MDEDPASRPFFPIAFIFSASFDAHFIVFLSHGIVLFNLNNKGLKGIFPKSGIMFSPSVACFLIGPNLINEVPKKRSIFAHFAA